MPLPPKDQVAAEVCAFIKAKGTFDEIRQKVVEKIEKQGVFDDIRERAKAEAEKYLEHVSDDTNKEVIRMRLRELIKNYDDQLQRIVDTFMREPWIEAELDKEVQQKVRLIYGLTSE